MPVKKNPHAPYWLAIEAKKREIIEGALEATSGNITRAARALGIDRTYLAKKLQTLGIDRKAFANTNSAS